MRCRYISCSGYPTKTDFTWSGERVGPDAIRVNKDDAKACTTDAWKVAVTAAVSNVTFVVEANLDPATVPAPLLDTLPSASIVTADTFVQFEYRGFEAGSAIDISLTPLTGDPDLYVGCDANPNFDHYHWSSASTHADSVFIQPSDANYCSDTFYISVYGFRADSEFVVMAAGGEDHPLVLEPDTPVQGSVSSGQYLYYQAQAQDVTDDIFFDLTPISGDPDLYISCKSHGLPTASHYTWSSTAPGSDDEHIAVLPSDAQRCQKGDPFYIGVLAYGANDASFTVVVSSFAHQDPIQLVSGIPQAGQITSNSGQQNLFQIDLPSVDPSQRKNLIITFNLTVQDGSAQMFASSNGVRPTKESHQWVSPFSYNQTNLQITTGDPHFTAPPVVVAVYAASVFPTQPGTFKIVGTVIATDADGNEYPIDMEELSARNLRGGD